MYACVRVIRMCIDVWVWDTILTLNVCNRMVLVDEQSKKGQIILFEEMTVM